MNIVHRICLTLAALPVIAATAAPLRVASWNIRVAGADRNDNAWTNRREAVCTLIQRERFDLVGLQEVGGPQWRDLREGIQEYRLLGRGREAPNPESEGVAIAYRPDSLTLVTNGVFWLSETPEHPGSRLPEAAYPRTAVWARFCLDETGQTFLFVNTHLDHAKEEIRRRQLDILLDRLKAIASKKEPILLAGDFNTHRLSPTLVPLRKHFREALAASQSRPTGPWRTYNAWQYIPPQDELTLDLVSGDITRAEKMFGVAGKFRRIDHLWATPDIRILTFKTLPDGREKPYRYPSDHFPIALEIQLKKAHP